MNRSAPGETGCSGLTSDWNKLMTCPSARKRTAATSTIRSVLAHNPVVSRSSAMNSQGDGTTIVIANLNRDL